MLCIGCLTMANAQTFTQRVQQNTRAGEGKVTITQDKAIDDLVNGQKAEDKAVAKPAATKPTAANKPADNKTGDKTGAQKSESEKAREQLASTHPMGWGHPRHSWGPHYDLGPCRWGDRGSRRHSDSPRARLEVADLLLECRTRAPSSPIPVPQNHSPEP